MSTIAEIATERRNALAETVEVDYVRAGTATRTNCSPQLMNPNAVAEFILPGKAIGLMLCFQIELSAMKISAFPSQVPDSMLRMAPDCTFRMTPLSFNDDELDATDDGRP